MNYFFWNVKDTLIFNNISVAFIAFNEMTTSLSFQLTQWCITFLNLGHQICIFSSGLGLFYYASGQNTTNYCMEIREYEVEES